VIDEELGEIRKIFFASFDERGGVILVFSVNVGAVFDEEPGDVGMCRLASNDEGGGVRPIPGIEVGAVVDGFLDGG
jgi:hypothetical protein